MGGSRVRAWRPAVPGVAEVFHARFTDHVYPTHTHGAWTLLLVDAGAVTYDLDRHRHAALDSLVTLLPPHVPHDGRAATPAGFRKRVLYLEPAVLAPGSRGDALIGAAVDQPELTDPVLRHRIHQLHGALAQPGEELQAHSRLTLIAERLRRHLRRDPEPPRPTRDPALAAQLRALLDAQVPAGLTLADAAAALHAHPAHLIRAFTREYGLPPHRYLTGRRLDLARRLLLDGHPPATAATTAGFYDQSHLTRHFRTLLDTTPAAYAAGGHQR
jgi:AraC-like DNA-binding protein